MNPLGCFDAAVKFCDGASAKEALAYAGYSESVRTHHAGKSLRSKAMLHAFRAYGLALLKKLGARTLGEEQHKEILGILSDRRNDPDKIIEVTKFLTTFCRPKKSPKTSGAEQEAIERVKSGGEFDELDSRSKEKLLLQRAYEIRQGDLGNLAKARLRESLLSPPKHSRDQMAVVRTALEVDGMLGSTSSALHLHEHSFPPAVLALLTAKMEELRAKEQTTIDAEVLSEGVNDATNV